MPNNREHDENPDGLQPELFWESIGKDDRYTEPVNLEEHIDSAFFEQQQDLEPEESEAPGNPDSTSEPD